MLNGNMLPYSYDDMALLMRVARAREMALLPVFTCTRLELGVDMRDIQQEICDDIIAERARQAGLVRQKLISFELSHAALSNNERLSIVVEELGEVARAIQEDSYWDIRKELIQVAACCVAWLEYLVSYEKATEGDL